MNNITIAGNLGDKAEVRKTQSGKDIIKFSVAAKGYKSTVWFNCVSFRPNHANIAEYLTKGSRVAVSGSMEFDKVEDGKGYYHSLIVNEITLQNSSQNGAKENTGFDDSKQDVYLEDEIPFS